jgi:hypothetical protein
MNADNENIWPVCRVGRAVMMGTKEEFFAARLKKGDQILGNGKPETVSHVWQYDGIVVKTESGKDLRPDCGDTITPNV